MRFTKSPGRFASCIGAALKGKSYPAPGKGMGGRNNKQVHDAFKAAVNSCK